MTLIDCLRMLLRFWCSCVSYCFAVLATVPSTVPSTVLFVLLSPVLCIAQQPPYMLAENATTNRWELLEYRSVRGQYAAIHSFPGISGTVTSISSSDLGDYLVTTDTSQATVFHPGSPQNAVTRRLSIPFPAYTFWSSHYFAWFSVVEHSAQQPIDIYLVDPITPQTTHIAQIPRPPTSAGFPVNFVNAISFNNARSLLLITFVDIHAQPDVYRYLVFDLTNLSLFRLGATLQNGPTLGAEVPGTPFVLASSTRSGGTGSDIYAIRLSAPVDAYQMNRAIIPTRARFDISAVEPSLHAWWLDYSSVGQGPCLNSLDLVSGFQPGCISLPNIYGQFVVLPS